MDDKRSMHRKFRRRGFAVRGLDEAAICWCAHEETDGFVSMEALDDLAHHHGVTAKAVRGLAGELVEAGRWETAPGGWRIVGYLEFNPSHAELESKRKKDRERKRRSAGSDEDSAGNPSGSDEDSSGRDTRTPRTPSRPSRPVPSQPVPAVPVSDVDTTTNAFHRGEPEGGRSLTQDGYHDPVAGLAAVMRARGAAALAPLTEEET